MSDNISRSALIRQIEIDSDGSPGWYGDTWQFMKTIESMPSTNEWIPCSERLPEDVEIGEEYPTVIFCTKDNVYVGFYEYYLGGKWWAAEDYTVGNVIAWMPLPTPYKGGEDE